MAIDANRVTALIDELGLPDKDKTYLTGVLTDPANERAATQFIGQRERHDVLTRKTQELATERAGLESRVNSEVTRYATELAQADERIKRIMKDYETAEISRTTAEARLRKVKETYNLSDEDIPSVEPQPRRAADTPVGLTEESVTAMLSKFEDSLMKKLAPELTAFPRVAAVLDEIDARHTELTGNRLTYDEKKELMDASSKTEGLTLMGAWKDKYKISEIEEEKRFDTRLTAERQKWDDDLKKRNSEDALRGVRRSAEGDFKHLSPVFREYKTNDDPGQRQMEPVARQQNDSGDRQTPPARVAQVQNEPKLSGAERAAAKFIERRNAGIPMGKEAPVGAGR
jgi:hypothetical protein